MAPGLIFLGLGVVAAGLLVLFIAQNTGVETIHFLFFSWQVAVWQPPVVVGIVAAGLLVAYFGTHHLNHAAKVRALEGDLADRDRKVGELSRRVEALKSVDAPGVSPRPGTSR